MSVQETSSLSGKTFMLVKGDYKGREFTVEDFACNVFGTFGWDLKLENPAVLKFLGTHKYEPNINRTALYGKIGAFGHIVSANEIGEEVSA